MQIREQLEQLVSSALSHAFLDDLSSLPKLPEVVLERPRDLAHGDWACPIALRIAKTLHKSPREIAQLICAELPDNSLIDSVDIAGPGFINMYLTTAALQSVISAIRSEQTSFGRSILPGGSHRVNLEYVSANPTGPMHVGHGRWAALGDSLARVMRHAGYDVSEEFYINDHGTQMDVFANSVFVRYEQLLGIDVELPEASYGGSYVIDLAQSIIDTHGDRWLLEDSEARHTFFREYSYEKMLASMKCTLSDFGVSFDRWFSERSLYKSSDDGISAVTRALNAMREKGYVYTSDGATWFQSSAFGDDKDRVLIKENGEYTYFISDVAYHYDKMCRGYDTLIDIWGADHHGYVKRCEAMLSAWGFDGSFEVILGQLVNLYRNGEVVRMSKRTGEMVTFKELVDEVGVDATRFLMLMRSTDQPIDFDIDLAKKADSSNPVYYVQYAHARICSIIRTAFGSDENDAKPVDDIVTSLIPLSCDVSSLTHDRELALLRRLDAFPDLIASAARDRAVFRLTHYATGLAGDFHRFYTDCRVLDENEGICQARLALIDATRIVLSLTLGLLGVSCPTKM